ncbi:MAG: LURP-one-related family protein [Kiritimatiellae bacterium]|nr:LURP-one-related family protein [Kiritimatiellia bacterium]
MFSLGDQFSIQSESGQDLFFVKSKLLSFGKKLYFQDVAGHVLAFIQQKVPALLSTYRIFREGAPAADLKKRFTFFKSAFDFQVSQLGMVDVSGNFFAHEFTFNHRGRRLATVSKKMWAWSDSYGVSITEGVDDVLFLAATIVIDQVLHDGKRNSGGVHFTQ